MCRKLIFLVSFMLVLGLVRSASADLGAHWSFDNDATDSVGSLNWTLNGGASYSTDAKEGSHSLQLDGVDDYAGQASTLILNDAFSTETVVMWFKANTTSGTQVLYDEGGTTRGLSIRINNGNLEAAIRDASTQVTASTSFSSTDWSHVAATFDNGLFKLYLNGAEHDSITAGFTIATAHSNAAGIGARNAQDAFGNSSTGDYFGGLIDDVRIYDNALSAGEIAEFAGGYPQAYNPIPGDGAMYEDTWASLAWTSGTFSVSHDVYIGENFDDVNDGAESTFVGNQAGTSLIVGFPGYPYPDGLVPGTTYYWRIDEVNDTEPNSPWKGNVWSFTVPPRNAYDPEPADGVKFVFTDVELNWTAGFSAKLHYVHFGDNFDDVNNAIVGLPQADATYTPGTLELEKVYYWRIDEFDGVATNKGDVWSFITLPEIPITDPDMICWWTLEEGSGNIVVDRSGHGNHGTFTNDPQWVDGYDGGALDFDGINDSVIYRLAADETWSAFALTVWAKANVLWQSNNSSITATYGATSNGFQISFDTANSYQYHASNVDFVMGPASTSWVHLALSYDGTMISAYYNGELVGTFAPEDIDLVVNKFAIGVNRAEDNWFDGTIDNLRIYNKALTAEEIQLAMRGDPLVAWGPSPSPGSTPYIRDATPLRWSPGDNASGHDVYFGTDRDAVADANASDTTGIYRGRQGVTIYTPPEVEWGGGPYYWRIDEYNTDATISKGSVWNFTVADFIVIEDFEDYNDYPPDEIFSTWIDGWEVPTNGSLAGHPDPPFAETGNVHGGSQSMPLYYENNFKYSEATMTLVWPRDWTEEGVGILSLWFMGNPPGFLEEPAGTYTMAAAGTDIWGTADEFRLAYKQISGAGSIVAQVLSVENTNAWAKAGVMIRESLDPGSKFAAVYITPGNGCRFQGRITTSASATSDTSVVTSEQTAITAPYWVRLDRDAAGNFNGYYSSDGVSWQAMSWNPQSITMSATVYIGLALTSHSSGVTCTSEFSDVSTTGTVSPLVWTQEAIGAAMASNDAEPMYVALNGSAVVYHNNPDAALSGDWTEWTIDLQEFAAQGVNLANVNTISIGFGDKNNLQAGGSGVVFFDDIRLYRPVEPEPTP